MFSLFCCSLYYIIFLGAQHFLWAAKRDFFINYYVLLFFLGPKLFYFYGPRSGFFFKELYYIIMFWGPKLFFKWATKRNLFFKIFLYCFLMSFWMGFRLKMDPNGSKIYPKSIENPYFCAGALFGESLARLGII